MELTPTVCSSTPDRSFSTPGFRSNDGTTARARTWRSKKLNITNPKMYYVYYMPYMILYVGKAD